MNIATLLSRHARYRPDHLAVIYEDQRLTYRAFNQRVNRLANALLGLGLQKGDKVATFLGNCLELLELYWAVAKTGMVIVPMSPLLQGQGLLTLLNDSDAAAVVTNTAFITTLEPLRSQLPALRHLILTDGPREGCIFYTDLTAPASPLEPPAVEINDDDPYNIIYSSGTTGLPKGIVLTHGIRAGYGTLFAAAYRLKPESIILHVGSLIFNGAFLTLMPAFFLGATYIFHRQFDPVSTIGTIAREKVTHIKMVPSQIVSLLNAPNFSTSALRSLEMIGSVGAPLLRQHKELIHKHLPNRFYELYGVTEGFMTILDRNDFPRKMDSVGTPPPFMAIRVVDEHGEDVLTGQVGEIIGRGPLMMPGYYKRPDLTANAIRDGWLYSGDLGYLDEEGFLYLVDRKKDMIISGGVNVYPKDIEEVVVKHPAVKEVAVFGIPSDKWGETPVAAVILKENETVTADELKTWVNERVGAKFQRLHEVMLLTDFPRSAAGKTLKRVMRESFWAHQERKI
ncbi:MAG: AMP-binding protein [Candidatus Promineifilaceae bacterium]